MFLGKTYTDVAAYLIGEGYMVNINDEYHGTQKFEEFEEFFNPKKMQKQEVLPESTEATNPEDLFEEVKQAVFKALNPGQEGKRAYVYYNGKRVTANELTTKSKQIIARWIKQNPSRKADLLKAVFNYYSNNNNNYPKILSNLIEGLLFSNFDFYLEQPSDSEETTWKKA